MRVLAAFVQTPRFSYILILFMLFLYLSFPCADSTIDAWSYAASVQWGEEIFRSHHLLYNVVPLMFYKSLVFLGFKPEPLALSILLNGVFAAMILVVLLQFLQLLQTEVLKRNALLLFTGSSFAIMRFATENETYIIPVFLSLWASYFFYKALQEQRKKHYFLSGSLAALACLFHQIHFFWWLILLLSLLFQKVKKRLNFALLFLLPALMVPLTYLAVIIFDLKQDLNATNIMYFVFEEFHRGNVDTLISTDNFKFFFINIFRTFFQLHGYFLFLFREHLFFILPLIISSVLIVLAFVKGKVSLHFRSSHGFFFRTHLLIVFLQLLFAFYSVGNAEFMVILPPLSALLIACLSNISGLFIRNMALAMLIWNFSLGILPLNKYDFNSTEKIYQKINADKDALYILFDKIRIENRYYYDHGGYPNHLINAPYYYIRKNKTEELEAIITNAHEKNKLVLTDCIGNRGFINRANMLQKSDNESFLKRYSWIATDSIPVFYGKIYLYQIRKP
jgi:hypothetical protein